MAPELRRPARAPNAPARQKPVYLLQNGGIIMTVGSINTNASALAALQNLNATQTQLTQTQNRINTGLKIASAKDNGAIWAIAQNQRSDISAYGAVTDSLNRVSSTIDVAVSAGETVSDLLNQLKAKALAAADASLDPASRSALNEDFKALRDQIKKTVSSATFNGANLLQTGATALYALANASGSSKLTVQPQILGLGAAGSVITLTAAASFNSAATASALVSVVSNSITAVNAAVAKLGTASQAFALQTTFVSKLTDTLTTGVGNLVDADVAKESANLTALQTKQQLGIQALSIANQGPSALLSLFK
jgi:flagellin